MTSRDTMMNDKRTTHTPGPWKMVAATHFESGLTYISVQPVSPAAETMRPLLMASGEHHICRMTHTAAQHAIAMHEANARLIAAAPELLELSRFLIERLDDFERDPLQEDDGEYTLRQFAGHVSPAIERLRAAIAAAEVQS